MPRFRNDIKLFDSIVLEIDSLFGEMARRSGLTESSFWILYYLTQLEEEITQRAICERWTLSKQTVNNAIGDLQKKDYIYLVESTTDRRTKQIFLTKAGEEFTEIHIKKVFKMEENIFSKMSEDERTQLMSSSKKYLQLLQQELALQE